MQALIFNSLKPATGDIVAGVQIAPFGEYDGVLRGAGGKTRNVVQTLDVAAFNRILDAWRKSGSPELLVDADHDSCSGGSTRAYAWASNLAIDDTDGLVADFRLTNIGRESLDSREYRFVSPVFECDKDGNALALTSIALTNCPNLPVSCVLNRTESADDTPVEDKQGKIMNELKSMLGLEQDAADEAVIEAVKALQQRVAEVEAEALNAEAEAVAEQNKDKIANRDAFVKLYTAHGKDVAMAFIATVKAPAKPQQTILNAKTTATPQVRNSVGDVRKEMASLPPAERAAFYAAHKADF